MKTEYLCWFVVVLFLSLWWIVQTKNWLIFSCFPCIEQFVLRMFSEFRIVVVVVDVVLFRLFWVQNPTTVMFVMLFYEFSVSFFCIGIVFLLRLRLIRGNLHFSSLNLIVQCTKLYYARLIEKCKCFSLSLLLPLKQFIYNEDESSTAFYVQLFSFLTIVPATACRWAMARIGCIHRTRAIDVTSSIC